ncbi:Protein yippee-like MOH1 [Pichia kudriavzevii]|uniref:Protein yippee-like MOH1 n=1 Tax=Pichia kudriavzevii TaxID=4909 RepID=A0A1V2LH74_PICKU|nr:Protein yippee-like MOH1 [Pichia kudriavzevii]
MGRVCVDYFDLSPSSRGDITSGSSPKSNDRANITGKIKYRRPSATRSSISSIYSGESNTRRSSSHSQYSFGSVFSGVTSGARRSVSSGASSVFPGEVKYTFHNVFGNDMGEASHGQQQLRIGESRLNTNGDALDGGVGMHGIDFGVNFWGNKGNAYFVKNVLNVRESKCETMKNMRTGRYGVKSITCVQCDSEMGWKYITSVDPDERYKVGKYVVERNMMDVYKVMS